MKIESRDTTVRSLLKSAYYLIRPRFQRPYSWERENVEDFWVDTIQESEGELLRRGNGGLPTHQRHIRCSRWSAAPDDHDALAVRAP